MERFFSGSGKSDFGVFVLNMIFMVAIQLCTLGRDHGLHGPTYCPFFGGFSRMAPNNLGVLR